MMQLERQATVNIIRSSFAIDRFKSFNESPFEVTILWKIFPDRHQIPKLEFPVKLLHLRFAELKCCRQYLLLNYDGDQL